MVKTLSDIAAAIDADLDGDGGQLIIGIGTLRNSGPEQISFFANPRYRQQLRETKAAAVILKPQDASGCATATLQVANPELAYAQAAVLFTGNNHARDHTRSKDIHKTAWLEPGCHIAADVSVGPHAVIETGVTIASGVTIGPGCVIRQGATIGADSHLIANVTVCHEVSIGERVLLHPGVVIGSDGFGYANDAGQWVKIEQLGSVRVDADVEIGANTTVDRGALEDTIIEHGVKLDNQVQIAHNVFIGAHTAIAGCVGIAGSARIGRYCQIGGGVGISGHLEISDHVIITGMSLVTKSIPKPGVYSSGLPVAPNRFWNKITARLRQLEDITQRLRTLENK